MERLIGIRVGMIWGLLFVASVFGEEEIRTWTLMDGQTVEAKYKTLMGKTVILENDKKKQTKVDLARFTPDDREFIELENPPTFKIDIRKKSKLQAYSDRFDTTSLPVVQLFTFGVRAKQRSAGNYNHELTIEFFVIAAQRHHNNKFILVDHQTTSFTPSNENNRSHEFWSPRIAKLEEYAIRSYETRGKKYDTFLILIADKRGKVIMTRTPNKWVLENLDNLRELSIGNFMDTTCTRVYPGRPRAELY